MAKVNKKEERDFKLKLWEEREHVSEISGQHLGNEPNSWYFAHVIGKGAYPAFRCKPENIVFMTQKEHFKYDHETDKAKQDPLFDWVFERAEQLKQEYHKR